MRGVASFMLTLLMSCQSVEPTTGSTPPTRPPPRPQPEPTPVAPAQVMDAATDNAGAPGRPPNSPVPAPVDAPAPRPADGATAPGLSDEELLAAALGVPAAALAPPPLPAAPPATPARPAWTPEAAADGGWGVRVLSITAQAQPPFAVLGLSDGKDLVVRPGDFVPQEHVVVMAIGSDAVQVAYVEPDGDRARIRSEILTPLHSRSAPPIP